VNLSVVIVNFNSTPLLVECLDSIRTNLHGIDAEVIVVDNGPVPVARHTLVPICPGVRLISNPRNMGFSKAVNQGASQAEGRYILVMNPDVRLTGGDNVEGMISFMDTHPDVGLLLPKLVNPDGSLQYSCRRFYDVETLLLRRTPLGRLFPNHPVLRRHLMLDWDHRQFREVDWGLGASMLVRKELLDKGQMFDPRFFLYFEDVDLCVRLWARGYKVVYYPHAVMVHEHRRESAKGLFGRARMEHFRSLVKFMLKHRGLNPKISHD